MSLNPWVMSPLLLTLAGCASVMSGLDGQGKFSCKAPDGISCASLSGVYANAVQNNLPGQKLHSVAPNKELAVPKILTQTPNTGEPIRSAQKVRRVWLAPWEDDEEVLHDQSYFYLVVDPGRWQLEHSLRNASQEYRPIMAPKALAPYAPKTTERPTLRMERVEPSQSATDAMTPQQSREAAGAGKGSN